MVDCPRKRSMDHVLLSEVLVFDRHTTSEQPSQTMRPADTVGRRRVRYLWFVDGNDAIVLVGARQSPSVGTNLPAQSIIHGEVVETLRYHHSDDYADTHRFV